MPGRRVLAARVHGLLAHASCHRCSGSPGGSLYAGFQGL